MQRVLPVLAVVCFFTITNCLFAQNTPTIFCPPVINELLPPGACEAEVNFQVSASSNGNSSSPLIFQIDGTGYTSGDVFPIGTTTLQFVAADTASPFPFPADTCTFDVNVVEYVPNTPAIVTDDDLWISIPPECEMYLLPSTVLEGNYGCYDDFEVDVEETGSNYIGPNFVGQTLSYVVTNTETGMTGWGEVTIEDKAGPLIQNCDTVRVACMADTRPTSEGGDIPDPLFSDCHDFTEYYQNIPTPGTCLDPYAMHILRFWTAVDELGNVSSCNQNIIVDRVLLPEIAPICPPDTMIECVFGVIPDFSPEVTGYPTVVIDGETYDITESPSICNITSEYEDLVVEGCGNTFKIIRVWVVFDWCLPIQLGINPWGCTQTIAFMDTTPPTVSTPADVTVTANLPGCRAKPIIPPVAVTDCSDYSVFIFTPAGPIPSNGGSVPAPGLPLGTHDIEVRVTDDCGNMTTVEYEMTVVDQTQPNPVCDKHTVTSLDNTGYSFVMAESIDDGSTDNCCLEGFEIRRLDDNCNNPANLTFGEYVEFCCEDVGETIDAVLRVWDCYGNFNTCQVEIEVQDIHAPDITCPSDVTLECGDDVYDPALVGTVETNPALQGPLDGLATDNCEPINLTSLDVGQVDCGGGTIKRTYTATDPQGTPASCVQTIIVENNNQFTANLIVFPADITLNSCDAMTDPTATGVPTYPPPTECFQLMHGQEPDLVLSSNGACVKIERTWFVIDWCQYDPNVPNSPGRWTDKQIIVVMDQEGPTFPVCDNLTFCNFKSDCSDLAPDLSVSATDACTADNLLTYTWAVDLYDDGQPDPANYAVSGIGQNTANNYPLGSHRITYRAHDGCGNDGVCSFLFTIDDCKNPTASCMNGMIIGIMQTGMVPVNINQLESGSSEDNCTDYNDLVLSFNQFSLVTQLIFDCGDLGVNPVTVWVTDEAGNQGSCTTSVTVQDNSNACGGNPLIQPVSGSVKDEMDNGVVDVAVELNGNMSSTISTDTLGVFTFDNVPMGEDYTVTPLLDDDPLNGVSTFDLYLMQRHILGIEFLDSPYKIIAADVNKSGSVTTFDVVETRRVILNVVPTFPVNTSWRFVDANYTFPDPSNPFAEPFPEVCNINNLHPNSPTPNFVAVKTGDLNQSAATNLDTPAEDRNNKELVFYLVDKVVKKSEQVTVNFQSDLSGFLAYQFTLGFDQEKIELSDILPGNGMSASNFGTTHLDKGLLTAGWYQTEKTVPTDKVETFQLVFTAKADGQLSDLLHLNSRLTKAAGFDTDGQAYDVEMMFGTENGEVIEGSFELFQNVPNPFDSKTIIGFRLPEAANATLTIFDAAGKTLQTISSQYTPGYHEINIDNELFPTNGVYYYRLETPEHTATKKMTKM